jgi:hypothetical protein
MLTDGHGAALLQMRLMRENQLHFKREIRCLPLTVSDFNPCDFRNRMATRKVGTESSTAVPSAVTATSKPVPRLNFEPALTEENSEINYFIASVIINNSQSFVDVKDWSI